LDKDLVAFGGFGVCSLYGCFGIGVACANVKLMLAPSKGLTDPVCCSDTKNDMYDQMEGVANYGTSIDLHGVKEGQ
jgi:hypothetical protein